MNIETFAPLFSGVVASSLWQEEDWVIKIFLTMIALKGRDQVVRLDAYGIAWAARKSEKEVLAALERLSSPDKRKLEPQPFEGRRIQRVEGGWLILNGEKYQHKMQELFRRAANRDRMEKKRLEEKTKSKHKGPSAREVRASSAECSAEEAAALASLGAEKAGAAGQAAQTPEEQLNEVRPDERSASEEGPV